MKGIDVSSHNGTINYGAVKNDGVEVVIIKATEGVDFRDDYLDTHYWGARNAGISHIGFYHFMSERTNPSQQAEDFWEAIRDKQYDVKPCLDIETNNQGRSAGQITDRCLEFINRFKELSGQDCMIYTGGYFGRDNLDSRIKYLGGWIAHYNVSEPMATGFPLVGHQYTESGRISGVNTNCDVNNFNDGIFLGSNYSGNISSACGGGSGEDPISKAREFVGERALELQQKLNRAFGYGLAEDGIIGQASYNAIIDAQGKLGVTQDGLFGEQSFGALEGKLNQPQPAPQPQVDLNGEVAQLQQLINSQGFGPVEVDNIAGEDTLNHCPTVQEGANGQITQWIQLRIGANPDGDFGPATTQAVIWFQQSRGINPDGIVGRESWKKLLNM